MKIAVNKILVPVRLIENDFSIVTQVAELAQGHISEIYLIHVVNYNSAVSYSILPQLTHSRSLYSIVKEKQVLLSSWKKKIEDNYNITVNYNLSWGGNWWKQVLKHAKEINTDLIVLKNRPEKKWWLQFWKTPIENILEKSKCQVITLTSNKKTISEWKTIVIPVTNFVPEVRIHTILKPAKNLKLKIHLIAVPIKMGKQEKPQFYFLTETLKLLKLIGNLQVECQYIDIEISPFHTYLKYSHAVNADALMTNSKITVDTNKHYNFWQKLKGFFETNHYNHSNNILPV